MNFVLVSSCLLGMPVRYNGKGAGCDHPVLARWIAEVRVLPMCPELAGGLPTPRPPAEIAEARGGHRVLDGAGRVLEATGADVTAAFVRGARETLAAARGAGAVLAVLKEGSPSCGSGFTYDGAFSGARVPLPGVTAACLEAAGIRVFSEHQWEEAARFLADLERPGPTSLSE
jgi:uncharacterized protein YbbK (DUF523 family)